MTSFSEIRALQDDEKTLLSIASKLNDQLHRLKVEELALISMMKLQEEEEQKKDNDFYIVKVVESDEEDDDHLEDIDLTVSKATGYQDAEEEEEEEEEESDGEKDQLTMFIQDLVTRQEKGRKGDKSNPS